MTNIILIGPPGSGKGTQAEMLKKQLHLDHISSGEVLRKEVSTGTDFGNEIKQYMDKGEIGPVELITKVIIEHIKSKTGNGVLLDGFPRTMYQARVLEESIETQAAFYIAVSEDEIVNRITGRRSCTDCGKIYHITYSPPDINDICSCGSQLHTRSDDTEETIKRRISVFQQDTVPVIDFYRKINKLHTIDGEQTKDQIFTSIVKHL